MNKKIPILLIAGLLMSAPPAHSHHAFAAHFDAAEEIAIEGVVTDFLFQNPRSAILIDVTAANGEVEKWVAAGNSRNMLFRAGWTGEELKSGDYVRISGNPSRDGSSIMHWLALTRRDGTSIAGSAR